MKRSHPRPVPSPLAIVRRDMLKSLRKIGNAIAKSREQAWRERKHNRAYMAIRHTIRRRDMNMHPCAPRKFQ